MFHTNMLIGFTFNKCRANQNPFIQRVILYVLSLTCIINNYIKITMIQRPAHRARSQVIDNNNIDKLRNHQLKWGNCRPMSCSETPYITAKERRRNDEPLTRRLEHASGNAGKHVWCWLKLFGNLIPFINKCVLHVVFIITKRHLAHMR